MDLLRTRVKAAAVANLTDARYFAALGVDLLGFALEPGATGFVDATTVTAIRDWVEGPQFVGEFGHSTVGDIARQAEALRLDAVQVGPFGKTRQVGVATGLPVYQELILGRDVGPVDAFGIMEASAPNVAAFVLNFSRQSQIWSSLRSSQVWGEWIEEVCAIYPVYLDAPAEVTELPEILADIRPLGLQITGGEEEAVGIKSFEDLDEWFEHLRVE